MKDHVDILFLVKDEDELADAKAKVQCYIEDMAGREWWSGGEIIVDSKRGNMPLAVAEIDVPYVLGKAAARLSEANALYKSGLYLLAAGHYRRAADLLAQRLSPDYPLWNMTSENYDVPENTDGWWVIDVRLEY